MALSSAGLGSGLDINGIIKSLMAIEQQPLTKLDVKEASTQAKISAFGTLKGAVSTVRSSFLNLQDLSRFIGVKASSSDTSYANVTAKAGAKVAAYNLDVVSLANNLKVTSKKDVFTTDTQVLASASDITAAGGAELKLTFGSTSAGVFSANSAKSPVTFTLDAGSDGDLTLAEVRDQINAKNAGVTASLVKVADGDVRLSLVSSDTGLSNGFKLEVTKGDSSNLSKLAYDPTAVSSPNFEVLAGNAASDAEVKLNGVSVVRSSNTLTDVVDNLTINLTKVTTTAIKINVGVDSTGVTSSLDAFVKSYNDSVKQLSDASAYDATNKKGALLNGDSTVRGVQLQLRKILSTKVTGVSGLETLSDLGVAVQKDGTLTLNKTKLDAAIAADPSKVAQFFGAYDKTANPTSVPEASKSGLVYQVDQILGGILDKNGSFENKISSLNSTTKDIAAQRKIINARLVDVEARYRTEYTNLDVALASMQRTSSWLSQNLANLPKIS